MVCCINCFAHPWLKQHVTEISKTVDQCDFCGSEDVPVVEVGQLSGLFHNLLSMYEESDNFEQGEPLISLVQWHWNVFDEDHLPEDEQASLLEAIANADWDDDDGEPLLRARELYVPPAGRALHTTHRERWEEFCFELREHPEEPVPLQDYLAEDFAIYEATLQAGTNVFRARRGFVVVGDDERLPYGADEIAAPPVGKALAGRANVNGQRVLYCADQELTAIAETRPPRGFCVSVATLRLRRHLRILDLTKDVEINPFTRENLEWFVEVEGLLDAFAEDMSRPLERDDDQTHYLPCQKLADYIRDSRFDGIRYPSALHAEGTNVVLFDPDCAEVTDSKLVRISDVEISFEEV